MNGSEHPLFVVSGPKGECVAVDVAACHAAVVGQAVNACKRCEERWLWREARDEKEKEIRGRKVVLFMSMVFLFAPFVLIFFFNLLLLFSTLFTHTHTHTYSLSLSLLLSPPNFLICHKSPVAAAIGRRKRKLVMGQPNFFSLRLFRDFFGGV